MHSSGSMSGAAPTVSMEVVRQLTPDLQREVDALGDAAEVVDGVRPFGEHKWLRLVRGDDRCTALLLRRGELLVGAAHCDAYHTSAPDRACRLTAELVVLPEQRGRGLGTRLIAGIVELAGEEVAQQLHLWAYGNSARARELATAFGFVPERTLLQYALPAERLPRQAEMQVRGFDPNADAEAWLALHNRVFAGHPEQGSWDMADLQARFDQAWFDPSDLLVAEDDDSGALLGFCWVKLPREPSQPGEIYIVGLAPDARGRGLGRKLVVAGLAHIQARRRPGAMLYVEADNAAAIALYEALGFEACFEHVCYERLGADAT